MYVVNYEVQIKNKNKLEKVSQASNYFAKLGDCLVWLNNRFNGYFEDYYGNDALFSWSIKGSRNSSESFEEFKGLFEISNESLIEKVLSFEVIKNKLEEFKK